ncbi:NADH dehydrogenase I chain A [Legionella birminghamensis]|uniref:NADH-quinone oxidoreductase subunit n=2 Tax=Legionella birminghamensis TaxID=28083 RepID=A0A378I5U4_9GAMM|nr:NADH dehydrogenase I chain A [Legionella birminghamensis]STX30577.1 NADH dehydrogenase I subunit A [Legionella birminghamensis]
MITGGSLLSKSNPNSAKNSPYECGFDAFESSHIPFDVRFYLVAILFIIFDLETAFFFPWALVLRKIGWFGFFSMAIFLGLLVIGFIYEWKRGALEWE